MGLCVGIGQELVSHVQSTRPEGVGYLPVPAPSEDLLGLPPNSQSLRPRLPDGQGVSCSGCRKGAGPRFGGCANVRERSFPRRSMTRVEVRRPQRHPPRAGPGAGAGTRSQRGRSRIAMRPTSYDVGAAAFVGVWGPIPNHRTRRSPLAAEVLIIELPFRRSPHCLLSLTHGNTLFGTLRLGKETPILATDHPYAPSGDVPTLEDYRTIASQLARGDDLA